MFNHRKRLFSLLVGSSKYNAYELFRWMMEDVLADILKRPKTDVPTTEAMDTIAELSGLYAHCVFEAPFDDVLGPMFMDIASHMHKKTGGIFFTPMHIARMMAKMMFAPSETNNNGQLVHCCDPASGSGVMMLATCQEVFETLGADSLKHYSLTCNDIEPTCSLMSATQLVANCFIHNAPVGEIIVYRGDALGDPADLSVILHATSSHIPANDVPPAMHPARISALQDASRQAMPQEQMALFDVDIDEVEEVEVDILAVNKPASNG